VMVGLGFAMLGLGMWSLFSRWRGVLHSSVWLHRFALLMAPTGFAAVIAGWITTEVGRQPYTIHGLLRTADSAAPLAAPAVAASLAAFAVVYFLVFGAGILYLLRLMVRPPQMGETDDAAQTPTRAAGIVPGLAQTPDGAHGHAN
ncbi:MAG: cytochrome ubiquinol oxidase subunit I, partial [Rhizobiaceae bacterium]